MKAMTWNMRRAKDSSEAWKILLKISPDVATLQEVGGIPEEVTAQYQVYSKTPRNQSGGSQQFTTVVLTKGDLNTSVQLRADTDWINNEASFYEGNIVYCTTTTNQNEVLNLVSVYSPAWHIPDDRLTSIDISGIKLDNNPKLYLTEILWAVLKNATISETSKWIVSGDLNSSVTFDSWGKNPRGNQEIIDRMNALGLVDCLSYFAHKLVPTFRNPSHGNKFLHQLDYLYVSTPLLSNMVSSEVLDGYGIFENNLSDHLPIVTEFR